MLLILFSQSLINITNVKINISGTPDSAEAEGLTVDADDEEDILKKKMIL